jgi:AcrR family transcriptional regulator
MKSEGAARSYRMAKRLEDVDETRQRIVEAAVALHGTVGAAHTTVSAIATRAGVQRSTVYRHFPDDDALFRACTGHWLARHPWPDPQTWAQISDPVQRCREGLAQLYVYYDANRAMLRNSLRDRDVMPAFVAAAREARLDQMRRILTVGWATRGRRRTTLRAAIRHALDFRTSESLADADLTPEAGATLMAGFVACVARPG